MQNKRIRFTGVEVRGEQGGATAFYGEPVVYDQWSELLYGTFYERMLPGCFDESLASNPDLIATINHDPTLILGRVSAGTLKLTKTPRGLAVEVPAAETSYARDLAVSIRRGDIQGMSFIFDDVDVEWGHHGGKRAREVRKAVIHEVSFVTQPCYSATDGTVGVRAMGGECPALPPDAELEHFRRRVQLAELA